MSPKKAVQFLKCKKTFNGFPHFLGGKIELRQLYTFKNITFINMIINTKFSLMRASLCERLNNYYMGTTGQSSNYLLKKNQHPLDASSRYSP